MTQDVKQPLFHNIPLIVIIMISTMAILYFSEQYFLENNLLLQHMSLSNKAHISEEAYRFLSYGFLHSDFAHLLFNIIWFIIFAVPIARYYGTLRFLFIFLGGIIIGGLSHSAFITEYNVTLIGASAGVTALCGAALRFIMKIEFDFRNKPILLHIYDSRFLIILALFSIMDIGQALFQNNMMGNNIAWYAHLSGLFFGAAANEHSSYKSKCSFQKR